MLSCMRRVFAFMHHVADKDFGGGGAERGGEVGASSWKTATRMSKCLQPPSACLYGRAFERCAHMGYHKDIGLFRMRQQQI